MQKSSKMLLIVASVIGLVGLLAVGGFVVLRKITTYTPSSPVTPVGASPAVAGVFTLEELAKHNTKTDCYIAYQKSVFNISWYIPKHEGGDVIIQQCGKVADDFSAIHPGGPFTKRAIQMVLQASKVGSLQN